MSHFATLRGRNGFKVIRRQILCNPVELYFVSVLDQLLKQIFKLIG